jgi:hypothetical protein
MVDDAKLEQKIIFKSKSGFLPFKRELLMALKLLSLAEVKQSITLPEQGLCKMCFNESNGY